jgi:hypothetical protein
MFPVGNEASALGYLDMFEDMLNAFEAGRSPRETFFDGYVVNSIVDAAYRSIESKRWEPIELVRWEHVQGDQNSNSKQEGDFEIIKRELLPDGTERRIVKNRKTGQIENR